MAGKKVKKVKCLVCGAIFDADVEVCPVCGVGPDQFEPIEEEAQQVRCLVCGAVFDADAEVCPVCGVGPDQFEPVDAPPKSEYRHDTEEIFMILGGGTAALSAAKAIRARNHTASIVLVSEEEALPYNRPMLTKALTQGELGDNLAIEAQSWYAENRVYPMLGHRIVSLDPEAREVHLEGGIRLAYDKLIYALGARCFVPPFPGAELDGVYAIRGLNDAQKVRAAVKPGRSAAVIGGGVLGLEAAWSLREAGMDVTVIETAPKLLAGKVDDEASALITRIAGKAGVKIIVNAKVDRIAGEGRAEAVLLADGTRVPGELVIVSCGIRANTAVAETGGLAIGRAVQVDAHMRASAARVYACGDCAEFEGMNYGIWPEATQQGEIAGANAAGEALAYVPELPALTMNALTTSLYSIGQIAGADESEGAEDNGALDKRFYKDGRLVGAILVGDVSRLAAVRRAVLTGAKKGEL